MIINLNIIKNKQMYGSRRPYGVHVIKIISYRYMHAGYHTKKVNISIFRVYRRSR